MSKTRPKGRLPRESVAVRLVIAPDVMRFAMRKAQAHGHPDAVDYLNAVINTAMLHEMSEAGALPGLTREEWDQL